MKLYIDLDNTLYYTTQTIVEMYDEDWAYHSDYVKIPWTLVTSYDFKELKCAPYWYIMSYFNSPRFFSKIHLMQHAMSTIKQLYKDGHEIIIVSRGNAANLIGKENFVDWLEYVYQVPMYFIGVDSAKYKDKTHIDMFGGILIDDELSNLNNSTASYNLCYGNYEWNRDWDGVRVCNWYSMYDKIKELINEDTN